MASNTAVEAASVRRNRGKHAPNPVVDGMKRCGNCDATFPETDFYLINRARGAYRASYCKPCARLRAKQDMRKTHYGISPEEYEELWNAQGGLCAICAKREPNRELSVDHDHETGAIRGLLCCLCNMGLGAFRDDLDLMISAMAYLIDTSANLESTKNMLVRPANATQEG